MTMVVDNRYRNSAIATTAPTPMSRGSRATALHELAFAGSGGWDKIIDDVLAISEYKDDWDGEGSLAPDPQVVVAAIKFAISSKNEKSPSPDRVIAGVNQSISFEWFDGASYTEFELSRTGEQFIRTFNAPNLQFCDVQ